MVIDRNGSFSFNHTINIQISDAIQSQTLLYKERKRAHGSFRRKFKVYNSAYWNVWLCFVVRMKDSNHRMISGTDDEPPCIISGH